MGDETPRSKRASDYVRDMLATCDKPYEAPKLTEVAPEEALETLAGLDLDYFLATRGIHRFKTAAGYSETDAVLRTRARDLLPVYEAGRAARKNLQAAGVEEYPVLGIDWGTGDVAAVTIVLAGKVIAQFEVSAGGQTDRSFVDEMVTGIGSKLRAYAAKLRTALPPPLPEIRASFTINQTFEDADPDRAFKKFKADLEEQVDRAVAAAEPGQPVKLIPNVPPPDGTAKGQRWRSHRQGGVPFEFTLVRRAHLDVPRGTDAGYGWTIDRCTVPGYDFAYDIWWKYHRDEMTLIEDAPAPVVQPCSACGETPPEGRTHYCPAVTLATQFLSDAWLRAHVEGRAAETGVKPCCVIGGVYKLRGKVCPFHDPKPEAPPPWVPEQDPLGFLKP